MKMAIETKRNRNDFSNWITTIKHELQGWYDFTPTHHNERERIGNILKEIYELESMVKNQSKPKECD